jgi:TolB-like protein/tetratricopeptide (TPR) repeat protein
LVVLNRQAKPPAQKIRSLAVLPLENLSGDVSQEYFADGMTDEMITDLGTVRGLRVISRTSVMAYKHVHKPLPVVARELGVDAVLEGTVLRVGPKVGITAQLVRAETDEHLWSHSYEGDLRDTLKLQDTVARTVADTVRVKITSEEQFLLTKTRSVNPEAQDAYLRGRYFWNKRTGQALTKAVGYFTQAIQIDPSYAEAYSGLADSYALLGDWEFGSLSPMQAFPKAESAAAKALQLDDNLGAAHASLALCFQIFDWNWKGSEAELVRAIQLNPSYASAHQWYGWLLIVRGSTSEGIKELKTAAALDPLSLIIGVDLADAFLIAHRYDESVRQSQRVVEMDPNFSMAHYQLGQAYAQMRRYDESIRELEEAISLSGRNPIFVSHLGYVCAASGKMNEALQMVRELEKSSKGPYFNPADIALIYVGLNRKDQAFSWLDRAYQIKFNPSALTRPAYDPLRSDPRFNHMLRRIGLIQ